ncbi:hypothetical protein CEXT_303201 [Caerostris extrusa]|uniref:Uncharacterized protein n=1 Tax=Caerostris extrusa TaxID=172846 RepID=A0AAV4MFF8_CAEEX|nr:hypothetical protein CEXT_303201 [Caerostris extrusa]
MRAQTQKGKGPFTTTTQLNTTRTSFDKNNRTKKKEQCGKREYTHRHTYDQQKSRNVHLHYRSALSYWLQSLVKGWGRERGGDGKSACRPISTFIVWKVSNPKAG